METSVFYTILASAIGAIVWEIGGLLFPKIKTPICFLLSLFHYNKVIIFSSFNDSKIRKYIDKGLENSSKFKYLSIRGFPLVQETYELNKALKKYYNVNTEYQFMIIDPNGKNAKKRADEYSTIENTSNSNIYLEEIRSSITQIIEQKKVMTKIKLKLHDTTPVFRICICDKYCFLSFYTSIYMGKNSPVLLFDSNTIIYHVFDYYFDFIWQTLPEVQ